MDVYKWITVELANSSYSSYLCRGIATPCSFYRVREVRFP
jgi:hypothetical protein